MEWYHVWWPWLTSKRVARFFSDSWVSCFTRATQCVSAVFAVETCVGCLSVTLRHAGNVSKQLNLSQNVLDHLEHHYSSFFLSPCADTKNPSGTPSTGALNKRGWDWNRRLSRKRCEIGPGSLWNVNVTDDGSMLVGSDDLECPLTRISRSRYFRHWIFQKWHEIEPYTKERQ